MKKSAQNVCDEAVYTHIFKNYATTLFRYLFYKTGNKQQAEDLTQEAFTRLWHNCATVVFDTANSYVFRIANNLLTNEFKHQKVVLKHEEQPQKDRTNENPEYLLEEKELRQQLEDAIAALPEKQRVVFLLSRIDKKTYREIAQVLGISKQAVEKRIYKALASLRQVVQGIK